MIKRVSRIILFFVILVLVLVRISFIFREHNMNQVGVYETYKKLPEDSVDAVFIGNSGVSRYWICSEAYDKYGMVVYPLATDDMPAWLVKNMIVEARKYQDLDTVIIDTRVFDHFDNEAAENHYVLDMLPRFSWNRIEGIIKTIKYRHERKEELPNFGLEYVFPVLSYHSKWTDAEYMQRAYCGESTPFLGFYAAKGYSVKTLEDEEQAYLEKYLASEKTDKRYPLEKPVEESLLDLLAYIENENLDVLFISSPTLLADEELDGSINTVSDILKAHGYELFVIDAKNMGDYEFDFVKDFRDNRHTNYYGAKKYTAYFADYLHDNYNFRDHRNDEDTSMFDGVSAQLEALL